MAYCEIHKNDKPSVVGQVGRFAWREATGSKSQPKAAFGRKIVFFLFTFYRLCLAYKLEVLS